MMLGRFAAGIAVLVAIGIHTPATAAQYVIDNPADRIKNPADKIYNPATDIKNPASNIYNPADRMNNPNPLSPLVPQPAVTKDIPVAAPSGRIEEQPRTRAKLPLPRKSYNFKTVVAYVTAAKKAFVRDDYREFLAITDDALRRINAGTLRASVKTRQKLTTYKTFGYGLLEGSKK